MGHASSDIESVRSVTSVLFDYDVIAVIKFVIKNVFSVKLDGIRPLMGSPSGSCLELFKVRS